MREIGQHFSCDPRPRREVTSPTVLWPCACQRLACDLDGYVTLCFCHSLCEVATTLLGVLGVSGRSRVNAIRVYDLHSSQVTRITKYMIRLCMPVHLTD